MKPVNAPSKIFRPANPSDKPAGLASVLEALPQHLADAILRMRF